MAAAVDEVETKKSSYRTPRPEWVPKGAHLKTAREATGKGQTWVAAQTGVSTTVYALWESGRALPTPKWLEPLAVALGLDVADLAVLFGVLPERAQSYLLGDVVRVRKLLKEAGRA